MKWSGVVYEVRQAVFFRELYKNLSESEHQCFIPVPSHSDTLKEFPGTSNGLQQMIPDCSL